jgi:outer membrane cobalamin receptor
MSKGSLAAHNFYACNLKIHVAWGAACASACWSFARAEEIVVPLVPQELEAEGFSNSENDSAPAPITNTKKRAAQKHENVLNPEEKPPTEEQVNTSQRPASVSAPALAKEIAGASVQTHGGAGDAPVVRLQGAPVHEPHYFLNGVSLQSTHNGSQNLMLIPAHFVRSVRAWPDLAPYWLPENSIGGAMEFSSFDSEKSAPLNKALLRAGSLGYWQAAASSGVKVGEKAFVTMGGEHAESQEKYLVLNNGNTAFNTSDDSVVKRENNDFSRNSLGLSVETTAFAGFGNVRFFAVGGHEKRGIPGAVETPSDERLERILMMGGVASEHFSPRSGAQTHVLFAASGDNAKLSSERENYDSKSTQLSAYSRWNVAIPDILFPGTTGVAVDYQFTTQESETRRSNAQQDQSTQSIVRASLSRSLIFERESGETWSTDASVRVSANRSTAERSCAAGTIALDCGVQGVAEDPVIWSGHVGVQSQIGKHASLFARAARAARRPFLQERMGSVRGIIQNASLRPEKSNKLTAGVSAPFALASCYLASDRDLIFYEQVDARRVRAQNLDKVSRKGCLAQASHTFFQNISPSVSYEYARALVRSASLTEQKELPRTPQHTAQLGFSVNNVFPAAVPSNWRLAPSTTWTWRDEMYLDGANFVSLKIPAQWNATLELTRRSPVQVHERVAIAIELENLLDDRAGTRSDSAGRSYVVEHAGYSGFPPPGRRYFLRAEWHM